ncbi:Sfi1 spindle body protein-domain-containing protein [Daldinia caldariorum]|uniref:Sfi1 spindle body protein-domain-containing protein n=1 Tax=Daldinia caldariorum TaxID=326644 RepID=UPI002007B852|nr:Sfi1 spindle body protein-domain-containing protein [Daldinia caldariorum]KAI1472119.1 Sfi1 spindle body protein-domain-containing protein [Daldinia caldariorum]
MALLHSRQSSAASSDISDEFSVPESIPESTSHRSAPPPAMSHAQLLVMERDKYSDEDIRILYEIVVRAEEILSELTPSSRLPTHALFKAYDEILPLHKLDPDEDQLISKLVFRVGGVKRDISLKEKFKVIMSQMEITVQMDGSSAYGSDAGDAYNNPASSGKPLGFTDGDYTGDDYTIPEGVNHNNPHNGNNQASLSVIEQHLENSAIAFRKKHQNKFSATSALRYWQKKSAFIAHISDQFDAARQADLEDDIGTKFEIWRTIAAEVDSVPPQNLPPNVYSKRIEGIAVRAHDIHIARTVLKYWRHNAKEEGHRIRNIEESSDPLERVAAKAHKYVMLSRAFANWSNRWEEESEKAHMAAKVYEMSLKSKAFGLRQRPEVNIRASRTRGVRFDVSPATNPTSTESAFKSPPVKANAEPSSAVAPVGPVSTAVDSQEVLPEASAKDTSSHEEPADTMDEMDETTLLARRHILRMRYYDAWEKYTAENLHRVRNFRAEQQEDHIARAIPIWRSEAKKASLEHEAMQYNAKRASYYNKTTRALDTWRQESQEKLQGHDEILENYAARANFYYKATRILPSWRNAAKEASQQQGVLELYADRAEYYYKATTSLPLWRAQAQHTAEHEKKLASYAERADYYYRARGTLVEWHDIAKQRRKRRLKEAHLETRRIVKKGMGQRCIAQWRERVQPSFERIEVMDLLLEDIMTDQKTNQIVETLATWREKAHQREEMELMSDAVVEGKFLEQWRVRSTYHQELEVEAKEHWKEKTMSRTLKNWNLTSLQVPNRPLIVANALEKKDRRLLRNGFENWYSRTADKLVPIELSDGSYKSVEQVVEDAQHEASLSHARGLLNNWKAAAKSRNDNIQQETYTPTPGRPRLFLGGLSMRETTTPLAPVPSRNWRASETAVRGSAIGGKASRSGRAARNLRVSWAQ